MLARSPCASACPTMMPSTLLLAESGPFSSYRCFSHRPSSSSGSGSSWSSSSSAGAISSPNMLSRSSVIAPPPSMLSSVSTSDRSLSSVSLPSPPPPPAPPRAGDDGESSSSSTSVIASPTTTTPSITDVAALAPDCTLLVPPVARLEKLLPLLLRMMSALVSPLSTFSVTIRKSGWRRSEPMRDSDCVLLSVCRCASEIALARPPAPPAPAPLASDSSLPTVASAASPKSSWPLPP
mmetsp:Transcript_16716/g.58433  ORF Transcript_16716/g.58433 Transcript_16716/m.58433 type:complete len:237 (+) Transcript_16716:1641-2351(+)